MSGVCTNAEASSRPASDEDLSWPVPVAVDVRVGAKFLAQSRALRPSPLVCFDRFGRVGAGLDIKLRRPLGFSPSPTTHPPLLDLGVPIGFESPRSLTSRGIRCVLPRVCRVCSCLHPRCRLSPPARRQLQSRASPYMTTTPPSLPGVLHQTMPFS